MPHSHYVEKARWGLDRSGLPYREEPHLPMLHRLATARAGGGSVPVLVHAGGCLTTSSAILEHADAAWGGGLLYPREPQARQAVQALVLRFDEVLGPHARRWAYAAMMPAPALLPPMASRGVPGWERALMPLVLPLFTRLVPRSFQITPGNIARSLAQVEKVFAEVGGRLADGRRFLADGRFSAADLSFAALASPVLLPSGSHGPPYPGLDAVPAAMRETVLRLRATPAGAFALRLYAEERAPRERPPEASSAG